MYHCPVQKLFLCPCNRGSPERQSHLLSFKQGRRDPTQDGVENPPWERAARSQPPPAALHILPGL